MSIRENILFGASYNEKRYKDVFEACALIPDMADFKHGDLSMIGENGVGLSGGQRARVALARAVYSRSNILFLDDPLSALDHQTAEFIVKKCFMGHLMRGRTTILITHRTELCMGMTTQLVQMASGRAQLSDPSSPVEALHRIKSNESVSEDDKRLEDEQRQAAIPDKFIQDEHREHGGVKASVYWEYIKAGKLIWWSILVCVLTLFRLIDIGETWFLKQWGEAYGQGAKKSKPKSFFDLPSPEQNINPWLIGFFVLAAAQAVAYLISQGIMLVIVYKAGKSLFARVMVGVANATFRFYDITPVGRLTNRLTSDINTIDGNISNQFQNVAFLSIIWISSMFVIGSVTPLFLIFAVGITLGFILIFPRFLPTSQSLRRLEFASLSPLFSNFGALAEGLTTIRAFNAQSRFQDRVIEVTDTFQKNDHYYWSVQAWLMYRFDLLSSTSTFLLTTLAIYTGVSPGLTAFVLTAASRFVTSTHALCKQYAQLQMEFVSVERVIELLYLDQELRPSRQPPAAWPAVGSDIVFDHVTIRYAPHFDPALRNVSLTIQGGKTTALIGRTGSGKSTLALSILFTTPPEQGKILIDSLDISTIDPLSLRQRITFLAQEPVLFPGSMRSNLDPLCEYSDDECLSVLHKIAGRHAWTLDTHVDTGGRNLSQGQRQLVGLARAVLRRSAIVIMDEATASVDGETAGRVLGVLREEMRGSTVVVVAHRREAVRGAEGCVMFCLLMISVLIFCAIYSSSHHGLTRWDGIYSGKYFVFGFLPQIFAACIFLYVQCIMAAMTRIMPFTLMAMDDAEKRVDALFLGVFPRTMLWPRWDGDSVFDISNTLFWLSVFTIPLQSSLFSVVLRDGVWRWVTVQGVAWTLVAIYVLVVIAAFIMALFFINRTTGMMWEPRSLADVIALLPRSNSLRDYPGTDIMRTKDEIKSRLAGRSDRLGWWRTSNQHQGQFYCLGETGSTIRRYTVERGRLQEKHETDVDLGADMEKHMDLYSHDIRYRYIPWYLRDTYVVLWCITAFVLLSALFIVSFVPATAIRKGFSPLVRPAPSGTGFSPANFLYSFIPSVLGMLLYLLFQPLDLAIRRLTPWSEFSNPNGATAANSLLIEYTADLPIICSLRAYRNRHYRVMMLSLLSVLFILLPVLAGGMFFPLTSRSGIVHMFPNLPSFYIALTLLILYFIGLLLLIPGRLGMYLPHAVDSLAEIISFVYGSEILDDAAFRGPRSKADLAARLNALPARGSARTYAFGVYTGRHGKDCMGIEKMGRTGQEVTILPRT